MSNTPREQVLPEAIEAAKAALLDLARQPPPRRLTATDAVRQLVPEIQKLMKLGYTKEAIAEKLCASGIEVAPLTVARVATKGRRLPRGKRGGDGAKSAANIPTSEDGNKPAR